MPRDQRMELLTCLQRCLVCLLVYMCIPASLPAQSPPIARFTGEIEIPMEAIDIRHGLSQGFTPTLQHDQDGYIWIATHEGLNRYDGRSFKVFRHSTNDSLSLASNMINFAFVNSENQLWVSTNPGILDRFDRKTESFIHHYQRLGKLRDASEVFVFPTSELPNRQLVFPASAGAVWNVVLPDSKDPIRPNPTVDILEVYPVLKYVLADSNAYQYLKAFPDGSIWTYGRDSLFWFSPPCLKEGGKPKAFYTSHRLDWKLMAERNAILLDDHKMGMYTLMDNRVLKFDPQKAAFDTLLKMPSGYPLVGSALIDSQNRLWTLTDKGNYLRIDLVTKTFAVLHSKDLSAIHITSADTYFADEDRQHNIWLGTNGEGFLKISAHAERFKTIPFLEEEFPSINDGITLHRVVRPGEKAVYDPEWEAKWLSLDHPALAKKYGLSFRGSRSSLTVDADGNFWHTAYRPRPDGKSHFAVIVKIDPETKTLQEIASFPEYKGGWSPVPLFIDRQNQVWFGNFTGEGVHYLHTIDPQTQKVIQYPFPVPSRPTGYPTVSDWYESEDGLFWLATTLGLFSFSKLSHEWRHWENDPQNPASLSDNLLFCVQPDPRAPDRFVWVGTYGAGLNCVDVKIGKVRRYTTEDGLPNNVVYAIMFDHRNKLWISTNQGLCRLDPLKGEIRNFSQADGLASNEFNRFQFSKSPDGKLYFGGIGGTTWLNPDDFDPAPSPAKTVINNLKLANKPIVFGHLPDSLQTGFYLDMPIEQKEALVFDHDVQMITLGFALLDLTTPSKNHFKYKLENFNDDWIDAGTDHEATYTNLSPGHYTFQVIGCNSDNVWSLEPATVHITIRPPWWGTWWFRIAVVLVVFTLIYSFYRYRLQQLLKVERLRNRIGQDLHDEIGSTLSSISLYSAVMQKTSDQLPPQTISILDKIIASTSQMMESMNDMVWTIKASNDGFEHVVNRMRAFAVNMTEVQEVEMTFEVDAAVEQLKLGMEARKNIYLIYKEAVNNAVKYAQCTALHIVLQKTGGQLILTITDNGIGFDPADRASHAQLLGGNGLAGMEMRSKAIGAQLGIVSEPGKGTTIRLQVAV